MSEASYLTVKQAAEKYPFSESSLRWLIFNAKSRKTSRGSIPGNGLDQALVRIGRKLLIHEPSFVAWLDSKRGR